MAVDEMNVMPTGGPQYCCWHQYKAATAVRHFGLVSRGCVTEDTETRHDRTLDRAQDGGGGGWM